MSPLPTSLFDYLVGEISVDELHDEVVKDSGGSVVVILSVMFLWVMDFWCRRIFMFMVLFLGVIRNALSRIEGLLLNSTAALVSLLSGGFYWQTISSLYSMWNTSLHFVSLASLSLASVASMISVYCELSSDSSKISVMQVYSASLLSSHLAFLALQYKFHSLAEGSSLPVLLCASAAAVACWIFVGGFVFFLLTPFMDRRFR